jgi:tetratricopeptide (TPR) repeat protein
MHPLNCKELTPEMLERPEYQALQALAYEGSKSEVAQNFLHHALDQLGKILLSTTKNKEKDYQEAMHCFEQGIEQKCGVQKIEFELYMGRAKLHLARHNFGRCKEDCLEALKWKKNEQIYFILVRSRYFVQKYEESIKYAREALELYPSSLKIKELCEKAEGELRREKEHM